MFIFCNCLFSSACNVQSFMKIVDGFKYHGVDTVFMIQIEKGKILLKFIVGYDSCSLQTF